MNTTATQTFSTTKQSNTIETEFPHEISTEHQLTNEQTTIELSTSKNTHITKYPSTGKETEEINNFNSNSSN